MRCTRGLRRWGRDTATTCSENGPVGRVSLEVDRTHALARARTKTTTIRSSRRSRLLYVMLVRRVTTDADALNQLYALRRLRRRRRRSIRRKPTPKRRTNGTPSSIYIGHWTANTPSLGVRRTHDSRPPPLHRSSVVRRFRFCRSTDRSFLWFRNCIFSDCFPIRVQHFARPPLPKASGSATANTYATVVTRRGGHHSGTEHHHGSRRDQTQFREKRLLVS